MKSYEQPESIDNVKISLNFKELLDAAGYIDEMEGIADGLYSLLEAAIEEQRGSVDDATLDLMLKSIEEEYAKHHFTPDKAETDNNGNASQRIPLTRVSQQKKGEKYGT